MPELMKEISFAKLEQGMKMPHLLDIQTRAFESLLQVDAAAHEREDVGLERVFKDDLTRSKQVTYESWKNRGFFSRFLEMLSIPVRGQM